MSFTKSDLATKRHLKEKVVKIYERIFQVDDPIHESHAFWEEFFLLKPNITQLQAEILKLNNQQIIILKPVLNRFISECIATLDHHHRIRILYALQTLCGFFSSVYKLKNGNHGFDVVHILFGLNFAEKSMQQLLNRCCDFLIGDWPPCLKSICLKLLLIISTGVDNVSQNTLLEYFMINNIFEAIMKLFSDKKIRSGLGSDAILLLTLLVSYRKSENSNPYGVKLSILDNDLALNGYGLVIANSLSSFCHQYITSHSETQSGNWISSLTYMVGNIFSEEVNKIPSKKIRATSGDLVALYKIVHLNRNSIMILAHTQADLNVWETENSSDSCDLSVNNEKEMAASTISGAEYVDQQPLNLLSTVFQYCSIVMQDTRSEENYNNVKLCFLILTCITEDQYANSVMHDFQLVLKVHLLRMPMRHRHQLPHEKPAQPLAATLIDLLCEFMMSHMMKKLPIELYQLCIGIVHRLICYEKKSNIRINYDWKELWETLIMLLKFLVMNENHFPKKSSIFDLIVQIVNIFNLFITYGDTFLASPRSYDLLYYEIIRMHAVFECTYSLALKYSSIEPNPIYAVTKTISNLINIRAIINHFTPKIEKWISENSSSPSADEILHILRQNYDSLTLKLLDGLDLYERYSEIPNHTGFFTSLVRNIITDTRPNIDFVNLDMQAILKEFSTIC